MSCDYKEIVDAINTTNNFSIGDLINSFLLLCSIITIIFLLIDKYSKGRPYLQVSIELLRSSLACVVIKNVGEVSLSLKKITFEEDFIKQLPEYAKKYFKDTKINNLLLHPGSKWVMCFGTSINDILKNYDKKSVLIKYKYVKLNRRREYNEEYLADFEQISHFLVYISEIDELSNEVKKSTNELSKKLAKIEKEVIGFRNLNEDYFRHTVVQKDNEK